MSKPTTALKKPDLAMPYKSDPVSYCSIDPIS